MSSKTIIAALIALGIAGWLFSGTLGQEAAPAAENALTTTPQAVARDAEPRLIRAITSLAEARTVELPVRGVTRPNRVVNVRAEVQGRIERLPGEKGRRVKAGEELCVLAVDSRQADLTQTQALFNKAFLEYKGVLDLSREQLQSEINIAQAKAQLETARANVTRAELALAKTRILAPFDGVVDTQPVEVGDVLSPGATCVTLMETNPILITGQIAEKNIGAVRPGDTVRAQLVHGPEVAGTISFIGSAPEAETRTYPVEVTTANPSHRIRSGLSVEMFVPLAETRAHLISSASLVLNDAGDIGVRVVDDSDLVHFHQVQLLSEQDGRVWAAGLPDSIRLIIVGQEEVFSGQVVRVDPIPLTDIVSN